MSLLLRYFMQIAFVFKKRYMEILTLPIFWEISSYKKILSLDCIDKAYAIGERSLQKYTDSYQ